MLSGLSAGTSILDRVGALGGSQDSGRGCEEDALSQETLLLAKFTSVSRLVLPLQNPTTAPASAPTPH